MYLCSAGAEQLGFGAQGQRFGAGARAASLRWKCRLFWKSRLWDSQWLPVRGSGAGGGSNPPPLGSLPGMALPSTRQPPNTYKDQRCL